MQQTDKYIAKVRQLLHKSKANKRIIDKMAAEHGLQSPTIIKELTELAIVLECRDVIHKNKHKNIEDVYKKILKIYKNQVNLSHRTSQSIMLQQYSTPAPIAYLAGEYILNKINKNDKSNYQILEPSAGNGLLTIAFKPENVFVNEIDDLRHSHLQTQPFIQIAKFDATKDISFEYGLLEKFDGVITNPPFGTLEKSVKVKIKDKTGKELSVYDIKHLDHLMTFRALDCMKDDGAAAIIVGGHTEYDQRGRLKAGKNRAFLSYLYHYYNVDDIINIDGSLYSRQGTSFNVRLILISGRKKEVGGHPPLKINDAEPIKIYYELYDRILMNFDESTKKDNNLKLKLKLKAKVAKAKMQMMELDC